MPRFSKKLALLSGLLTGSKAWAGPCFVAIDVTQRCNLHCLGCLTHSPLLREKGESPPAPMDISYELYRSICQQLKIFSPCEIILIGEGEPLLHPQLVEMVRVAKQNHLSVRVVTNGTLLNQTMVAQLIDAGIDRIDVSLWAVNSIDAERVYPLTGAETFARQMNGLELLASARRESGSSKPKLLLHQPLSRHNADNLPGLIDIARRYNCDQVSFAPLNTRGGRLDDHVPTDEQLRKLGQLRDELKADALGDGLNDILLRYKIGGDALRDYPCYVGWHYLRVDVEGKVSPCKMCNIWVGNLSTNSVEDVWNSPEMRAFRQMGRSKDRVALLQRDCNCHFCCHAVGNYRIHRILRWFRP